MVTSAFGFSVGDFIAGTKLVVDVLGAFKEAGGASSKYAAEALFLENLIATIKNVQDYQNKTPDEELPKDILKLTKHVDKPLTEFSAFLDKYKASLGKTSTKSTAGKAAKIVIYTIKNICGKVKDLRQQVEQSLQAVNCLLALQALIAIENLPGQALKPAQCAQIVNAIKIADIPTELDKQIQVLQRSAEDNNRKQDDHLQRVKHLRDDFQTRMDELQTAVGKVEDIVARTADQDSQKEQLVIATDVQVGIIELSASIEAKSNYLAKTMKQQEKLITALKSFLEDKAAMQKSSERDEDRSSPNRHNGVTSSWPPTTLPAAGLALSLLPTVVSIITAASATMSHQHLSQVAVPSIQSRKLPVLTVETPVADSSVIAPEQSEGKPTTADVWVTDFARTNSPRNAPEDLWYCPSSGCGTLNYTFNSPDRCPVCGTHRL